MKKERFDSNVKLCVRLLLPKAKKHGLRSITRLPIKVMGDDGGRLLKAVKNQIAPLLP